MDTAWKPNKWIAALLGVFVQPLAMLYVHRAWWAIVYFLLALLVAVIEIVLVYRYNITKLMSLSLSVLFMGICAVHAWFLASKASPCVSRSWYSRWYSLLAIWLGALTAVFLLRSVFYEPFRMPSASMYPTIQRDAFLLVSKYGYGNYRSFGIELMKGELSKPIHRGELMVFQYPQDPTINYIKRIIGLPGDRLEYRNKQLVINGVKVSLEKITTAGDFDIYQQTLDDRVFKVAIQKKLPGRDVTITVPAGHYFVMGDNRDNSNDSRYWGFVPQTYMVGKVEVILNPGNQTR